MTPLWPYLILAYHLELALACLEAWETAPAVPRLEPEVDPVARARRQQVKEVWDG